MTEQRTRLAAAEAVVEEEREKVRAELREAAAQVRSARAALEEATAKLHALVYKALQEKVIPVSTIHTFAGVAPSRVYQIQQKMAAAVAKDAQ